MIEYKLNSNKPQELRNILNPLIKKWFFSKFKEFSLPQLFGVMEIHSRNNILVSAPTGATKTLTGFLSILNELINASESDILEDKVYCIYISPLKALSNDVQLNLIEPLKEMEKIAGKKLGIRVAVRTGDTSASEKSKMLKKPPHILITTPESLAIVLSSYRFIDLLQAVEWCIVDEVHALAENKRGVHLSLSLERLQHLSPAMTRIGLSATIAPLDKIAHFLVGNENEVPRNCKICNVQFVKKTDLKVLSPVPDLINVEHGKMQDSMYSLIDDLIQTHKTTLIFTNTRAATERVIHHLKEKFPKRYASDDPTIGAHHGSLSKEYRHSIEKRLREGKLKVVVSSTSLELGIDIGYIDLVILLGSPKSVARALQRIGRSGHKLHSVSKGRIIVLDRDDMIECSVLLKSAIEKKIDRIHIPENALDVLAQQIYGIAIASKVHKTDLYNVIKKSYCYKDLTLKDFNEVLDYLSGKHISLEDRHIYAKIWVDEETGLIGRKGRMSRVIYMTNIGTIPDETFVSVKIAGTDHVVGKIDESFLERLRKTDVFVLGGDKYEFLYAKGMVAYVNASVYRAPTIPSWFSEMLPLSFDLALEIGKFRRLMEEKFNHNKTKKEVLKFINDYLYVDKNTASSIYNYLREQYLYAEIPTDKKIIIENFTDRGRKHVVVHSLYGRRVNDALSRAVAFVIARSQRKDVELGITDNGFYVSYEKNVNVSAALKLIKSEKMELLMNNAIEKTEILKRRFRHCAARSLMILRNYKGRRKRVGRQQVSSMILINAVKRVSPDFCILKEARREVLEDLMDMPTTKNLLKAIEDRKIKIKNVQTDLPSPFAFKIVLESHTDVLKIEDKIEFLKRMHARIMERIEEKAKAA
ncbi:ATP-dependent helicase [Candidatus Woesearchaeota archaeon]|nr:ATP-dependent helicase [Candidatus Woesearchaeota archaeon]|tara:strand:+ start:1063 stop:3669 length:2607 start_codon:yes stop_codon:yes gene_type:complete